MADEFSSSLLTVLIEASESRFVFVVAEVVEVVAVGGGGGCFLVLV